MWTFWAIASGIFFVIEIFTTGFLVFWLAIAALISMVVSLFTTNLVIQTIVFVISSAILLFFTRPLISKFLKTDNSNRTETNFYSLIGKSGIVLEDVGSLEFPGKVKISGEIWTAVSDSKIVKGTRVIVKEIDGVKLIVEPQKKTSEVV